MLFGGAQVMHVDGAWLTPSENATFFKGPFNPCKGSRPRHPVELVKTHVFATKLFNEIGIKTMVRLATKFQIPHTFVYRISSVVCLLALIEYDFLSGGESLILPRKPKAQEAIAIVLHDMAALKIASPELNLKYLGRTFNFPWSAVDECLDVALPATLRVGKGDTPRDVNMLLHFIEHLRKMIL